jgi:hypothetical protein
MKGRGKRNKFLASGKARTTHKHIERDDTPAVSSNIEAHDYDPETGQLSITYRGGRRYRYDGVPPELAMGLKIADSMGAFLHRHIIDKFPAVRLGLDEQPGIPD